METSRICKGCSAEFPIAEFRLDRYAGGVPTGHRLSYCRPCDNAKKLVFNTRHKAKLRAVREAAWALEVTDRLASPVKQCTKCKITQGKATFQADPRKTDRLGTWCRNCRSAAAAVRYRRNPEKQHIAGYKWRMNNPAASKAIYHRRRYNLRQVFVEDVDMDYLRMACNGRCGICGWTLLFYDDHRGRLLDEEADHIKPITPKNMENQGTHEWSNMQTSHKLCNVLKGNRLWRPVFEKWHPLLDYVDESDWATVPPKQVRIGFAAFL